MRTTPHRSAVDDRETMIRLIDIRGHEHIFAPYHLDTPLPPAPGLVALVRRSGHRIAGIHSIVHPPWWEVLYIEQAKNVCRRAGRLLCGMQSSKLVTAKAMVRWMPDCGDAERMAAERDLIEAHDPTLNRGLSQGDELSPLVAFG